MEIKRAHLQALQHIQLPYQKLLAIASKDAAFCNAVFKDTARNDEFVQKILQLYN